MGTWYCVVNGERYGPLSEQELREWISQGRVERTDVVWREGLGGWRPVSKVAEFSSALGASPPPFPAQPRPRVQPNRAVTVLVLGLLGFICFICGIIAWAMGSEDLAKMRRGLMDPSGEDMTRAGMICGIITTILGALALLWVLYLFLFVTSVSRFAFR